MSDAHKKITDLGSYLNSVLYQRETEVRLIQSALISGQHLFLLGEPGTGKTNLAELAFGAFDESYFFHLCTVHSRPEDVFGPLNVPKLTNEAKWVYETDGYLPSFGLTILDEIWKADGSILNTLLRVLNERKFINGRQHVDVPLRTMLCASNEMPVDGLDALYDRIVLRRYVKRINDRDILKSLFRRTVNAVPKPTIEINDIIAADRESDNVIVSDAVVESVLDVAEKIEADYKRNLSVRAFRSVEKLLQASAYIDGRGEVNSTDLEFVLPHVFVDNPETDYRESRVCVLRTIAPNFMGAEGLFDALIERWETLKPKLARGEYVESEISEMKNAFETTKAKIREHLENCKKMNGDDSPEEKLFEALRSRSREFQAEYNRLVHPILKRKLGVS